MKQVDIEYIHNFLDEVESLYEADAYGEYIPQHIEDDIANIRVILAGEHKNNG